MTRCLPTDTPSIPLTRVGDDNQRISDHITNRGLQNGSSVLATSVVSNTARLRGISIHSPTVVPAEKSKSR